MWYIYIYNGILLSHKKEWNNAICSNMDAPRDDHTKWSKSDRGRQISYNITYMWNLNKWYKWTYLQNKLHDNVVPLVCENTTENISFVSAIFWMAIQFLNRQTCFRDSRRKKF